MENVATMVTWKKQEEKGEKQQKKRKQSQSMAVKLSSSIHCRMTEMKGWQMNIHTQ